MTRKILVILLSVLLGLGGALFIWAWIGRPVVLGGAWVTMSLLFYLWQRWQVTRRAKERWSNNQEVSPRLVLVSFWNTSWFFLSTFVGIIAVMWWADDYYLLLGAYLTGLAGWTFIRWKGVWESGTG